jgi:hypothetical protein
VPANLATPGGLHGGKPAPAKPAPRVPQAPWLTAKASGHAAPGIGVSGTVKAAPKGKSLGLLASAEHAVSKAIKGVFDAAYPSPTSASRKGTGPLAAVQTPGTAAFGSLGADANLEGQALGQAVYHDPVGVALHTVSSIPGALSATVMAPLHIAGTAISGHPLAAAKEIAGLPGEALAPYAGLTQPGGVAARAQQLEKTGALPDLSLLAAGVGAGASVAGRAASAMARATRYGEDEFQVTKLARERQTVALQKAHAAVAKGEPDVTIPPAVPRQPLAARAKSLIHEAAATDRPPRRYSTDQTATPRVQPVGAPRVPLVARERSPNLFVSAAQTALDRHRIAAQQGRLHRVVDVASRDHLNASVPYASQLDTFTRPGEVVANVRGGPLTGRLGTTARGQVHSVNAAQQDSIRLVQEENRARSVADAKVVATMNPAQRDLITFVREGKIPPHDPVAGPQWMNELRTQITQARTGTGGRKDLTVGHLGNRNLVDNTRTLARAQKYIDEHGAGAVFNTDFERKAGMLEGELATSHRDPTLTRDTLLARRTDPQMNMLERWARVHPQHPAAGATRAAIAQANTLLEHGHQLRVAGKDAAADAKFAVAHDLRRQVALNHGLPSDLSYIPHLSTLAKPTASAAKDFRVDAHAPTAAKRNLGKLDEIGHTVRDPELISRASARNVANEKTVQFVRGVEKMHGVGPDKMTARQAIEYAEQHHLKVNPDQDGPAHFAVMSLGKFERDLGDREQIANADNPHLDTDPEAHAASLKTALDANTVGSGHAIPDTATGFKLYPTAAARELAHGMSPAILRRASRVKGVTSKIMLGTSPAWSLSMWPAYFMQGAMGGALTPLSWAEGSRWIKSLSPEEERTFRVVTGVDSPVTSSHGVTGVHNTSPPGQLADGLALYRSSPIGRLLAGKSPLEANMRFERMARVGSRRAVAYKGVKKIAVRKMIADSQGLMRSQDRVAQAMKRMSLLGKVPPEKYMRQALADQPAMEQMVAHVHNVLGDFHHMSRMERSTFNQVGMFYPWLRYSLKTAFHVLPAKHPLLAALGTYLGTLGEQDLTDLLGTQPALGTVYVGPQQPNTDPADREFNQVSLHSVNPLMNSVMDVIAASNQSRAMGVLPPYLTTALDYLYGVDSFTGQPLKDTTGVAYANGKKPNILQFGVGQTATAFAPVRAINAAVTGGKPQSADSVPFLGMQHPITTAKAQATPRQAAVPAALDALLPFLPKPASSLSSQIAYNAKQAGGAFPHAVGASSSGAFPTAVGRGSSSFPKARR